MRNFIKNMFVKNSKVKQEQKPMGSIQLRKSMTVKYSALHKLGGTPQEAHKPCLVETDMILKAVAQDSENYYFEVFCNYTTIWSEKNLQHAKNGSIIYISKNDFKTIKIRRL